MSTTGTSMESEYKRSYMEFSGVVYYIKEFSDSSQGILSACIYFLLYINLSNEVTVREINFTSYQFLHNFQLIYKTVIYMLSNKCMKGSQFANRGTQYFVSE